MHAIFQASYNPATASRPMFSIISSTGFPLLTARPSSSPPSENQARGKITLKYLHRGTLKTTTYAGVIPIQSLHAHRVPLTEAGTGVPPIPNHDTRRNCRRLGHERRSHTFVRCFTGARPAAVSAAETETQVTPKTRTQRIMESILAGESAGGAGGTTSYEGLKRADSQWAKIRNSDAVSSRPAPAFVTRINGRSTTGASSATSAAASDLYDVVICGGTLGVFTATVLAMRGQRVAIVERGKLIGRSQEWNISRKGLLEFVKLGLLTEEEINAVIAVEFNPNRVGTKGGEDIWVEDILNLGVSPAKLIEIVKDKFLGVGGIILEGVGVSNLDIFDDEAGIVLDNGQTIRGRLVLDAMGNASPIVRQIRWGQKPDGICLVVGSCARGFQKNDTSDVLLSTTPVLEVGESNEQLFWEAFPAGSGPTDRTTYLFSYMDATSGRPSLEDLLDKYWDLMPGYQGVKLDDLEFLRVMYGFFTTYRKSPLPSAFDRVVQIGDASGIQSPLSFGGFGSIARHLPRLTNGLIEALEGDILDAKSLSFLNPYMPNLSGAWLFQRAMSVPPTSGGGNGTNVEGRKKVNEDFINELLSVNFKCMQKLGNHVLLPFLEDVIKFGPLARTMASIMLTKPSILPAIFKQTGVVPIFDWSYHFVALGIYTFLSTLVAPRIRGWVNGLEKRQRYIWNRRLEAWEYGSGLDYQD